MIQFKYINQSISFISRVDHKFTTKNSSYIFSSNNMNIHELLMTDIYSEFQTFSHQNTDLRIDNPFISDLARLFRRLYKLQAWLERSNVAQSSNN